MSEIYRPNTTSEMTERDRQLNEANNMAKPLREREQHHVNYQAIRASEEGRTQ